MALRLGVTERTVYTWENGIYRPRGDMLHKVCELYHVTPSYVLDGVESAPEAYAELQAQLEQVNAQLSEMSALVTRGLRVLKTEIGVLHERLDRWTPPPVELDGDGGGPPRPRKPPRSRAAR